jgi:hypothetical protein
VIRITYRLPGTFTSSAFSGRPRGRRPKLPLQRGEAGWRNDIYCPLCSVPVCMVLTPPLASFAAAILPDSDNVNNKPQASPCLSFGR